MDVGEWREVRKKEREEQIQCSFLLLFFHSCICSFLLSSLPTSVLSFLPFRSFLPNSVLEETHAEREERRKEQMQEWRKEGRWVYSISVCRVLECASFLMQHNRR